MENMRKIVYHCDMNMVGTDSWEFVLVPKEYTDAQIEELGQQYANDNAEVYGFCSYPNEDLEEGEEDDCYDEYIGASWYDYDPEKHDMHTCSGIPEWDEY